MNLKLPTEVQKITNNFIENNYQIYLVGGALRDFLLEKDIKDWDFTTDATPEEILKIIPEGFYNNKFGTVGISTKHGLVEITTMRKESQYSDSRHPNDVTWTKNIEDDLSRRDFTINAMALKLEARIMNHESRSEDKEPNSMILDSNPLILIDPFNGQKDLEERLIRSVRNPDQRFQEDALRLIRAIRFATQLNFDIEPNTHESIRQNALLILKISWERIRDELLKILSAAQPSRGILLLKETGLLKLILPELEKCFGIQQEGPKHDRIYDIGEHSVNSLKFCPSTDPIVRFAALIHDIGKPNTKKITPDGNVTFYHHDVEGAKIAEEICNRLKFSNDQKEKIITLVRWHLFTVDENQTDSAIRRFIKNIGIENIDDMLAVRESDRLGGGSTPTSWRTEKFKERIKQVLEKPFTVTDLKVNGNDIMETLNIPPSRKVGEILDQLFQEVLEDSSKNNSEYLLQRIKQLTNP